ncbi:MAG: gluconokinase [Maribacter sp.]
MNKGLIYIIMGVSGCGKSTIGELLASKLRIPFFDGDDFHPETNITKMAKGIPLNDKDRKDWLQSLNELASEHKDKGAVIACSALKEAYRTQLRKDIGDKMAFVYLSGSFDDILTRLKKRKNHYMPVDLLKSQFDILEVPKDAISVSILLPPEEMVSKIINYDS